MEQWSSRGFRIEIDRLPGHSAVYSDEAIPEIIEPEVLSTFRRRVLQRADEDDSYRLARIEAIDNPEAQFHSLDRTREDAKVLRRRHPELSDAPIVENVAQRSE
jgi:hypothetical protein